MKKPALFLTAIVLMTGCTSSSTAAEVNQSAYGNHYTKVLDQEFSSETTEVEVYDAYTEVTDQYEVHIPALNTESEEGEAFNQKLMDAYLPLAEQVKEENPTNISLTWESHWCSTLLSLEMITESDVDDQPYRKFYYYDVLEDKELSSEEVISGFAGLETTAVRQAMMFAAAEASDENMKFEPAFNADRAANLLTMRAAAVARANNLNASQWLFYPNEDHSLDMYLSIYSEAAGMWIDTLYNVQTARSFKELTASNGFVSAKASPYTGEITISFTDTSQDSAAVYNSADFQENYHFVYDYDYQVDGCFSAYEDMRIVNVESGPEDGSDYYPILFLLTEYHTIEYVDIFRSANYGSYISGGPVYIDGAPEIESMEEGTSTEDGYTHATLYGVDGDGIRYDANSVLYEGTMAPLIRHTWQAEKDDGAICTLSFSEEGLVYASFSNNGIQMDYTGYPERIGMNGSGVVYASGYIDSNGEYIGHSLYILNLDETVLYLQEMNGQSVFDLEPYMELAFYETIAEG